MKHTQKAPAAIARKPKRTAKPAARKPGGKAAVRKPQRRQSSRMAKPPAAAKSAVQPPPALPYIDRGKPIPDVYDRDVLRMLARDPEWVFVYWEVTPQRIRQLQSRFVNLHTKPWKVKLVDTSSGEEQVTPIFLGASNWYLPARPRTPYRAELGFMDGSLFVKVLVSNEVRTPADTVSERGDEEWMILRRDLMRMLHLEHEKDLFGMGRPFASADRFRDLESEEAVMLERLAQQARRLGSSMNVPAKR